MKDKIARVIVALVTIAVTLVFVGCDNFFRKNATGSVVIVPPNSLGIYSDAEATHPIKQLDFPWSSPLLTVYIKNLSQMGLSIYVEDDFDRGRIVMTDLALQPGQIAMRTLTLRITNTTAAESYKFNVIFRGEGPTDAALRAANACINKLAPLLSKLGVDMDLSLVGADDMLNPKYVIVVRKHDVSPSLDEWRKGYIVGTLIVIPPWLPKPPFPWPPKPPFPWPPPIPLDKEPFPILMRLYYTGPFPVAQRKVPYDAWKIEFIDQGGSTVASIPAEHHLIEDHEQVGVLALPKKVIVHLNILTQLGWEVAS